MDLDRTDVKILRLLQTVPDITAAAIGEQIGASQATCWRRIQRFKDEGLIPDQYITLDRKKAGFHAMVFAQVKLTTQGRGNLTAFSDAVQEYPEVQECYVLMGAVDFLLRIVTQDIEAYERFFFEKLSQLPGVQEVTSNIAMSEIKRRAPLPF